MIGITNPRYSLRIGQEEYGPVSHKEIMTMLESGELPFDMQVFDEKTNHWLAMARHPQLAPKVTAALRNSNTAPKNPTSIYGHWYFSEGPKRLGPFTLVQMLQFLQQKRICHDDLVYHRGFYTWQRLADVHTFGDENVKALSNFPMLKAVFKARKNPRVNYSNKVLVYDDNAFYNGKTWSLSDQGLGVVIDKNTPFKMDQTIHVHINRHVKHEAVQARCRVVSRHSTSEGERLGLVFEDQVESLNDYIADIRG